MVSTTTLSCGVSVSVGVHFIPLWIAASPAPVESLEARFEPPPGALRVVRLREHFASFARSRPLEAGTSTVRWFDGRAKPNQRAHAAVFAMDVGTRDLQQCADFAIRMLAEHRRSLGGSPCFTATSGEAAPWSSWRSGLRPKVRGRTIRWRQRARPDRSDASFRRYLDFVFSYAGSISLSRDTTLVQGPPEAGDMFIEPGSPGHVVLIVDEATAQDGSRWFLLAQSFMPAQSPHVLLNPSDQHDVWYRWDPKTKDPLVTPEWTFEDPRARRLKSNPCAHRPQDPRPPSRFRVGR